MRFACVWLERLLTDSLVASEPALAEESLVAVEEHQGAMLVTGVSAQAEAEGVRIGTSLADARALAQSLVAREVDPGQVRSLQERLAKLASRYGPWVSEPSALPRDKLVVDVTGCGHLFGGEVALLDDLLRRGREMGVSLRAAIADRIIGAMALAEFGPEKRFVAEPGKTWPVMQSLPVEALGLEEKTARAFERLGLRRISDLNSIPLSSLRARFGAEVVQALDRAKGKVPEPIAMRPHLPPPRLSVEFSEPLRTPEEVRQQVARLTSALCDRLMGQRLGAERVQLSLGQLRAGRLTQRRVLVGVASPLRDPERWLSLMAQREAVFDPAEGVEKMDLRALVAPCDAEQADLHGKAQADSLNALIETLSARLGEDRVVKFVEGDTHLPEALWQRRPALESRRFQESERGKIAPPGSKRPLTLFATPESISVTANPEPTKFRWRGTSHSIRRATGPERIALPWWQGSSAREGAARDYWRVETTLGNRFWIYQRQAETDEWYLQGRFA